MRFHKVALGLTGSLVTDIRADGRRFDSRVFSNAGGPVEVDALTGVAE
jgi:hypothetical protein